MNYRSYHPLIFWDILFGRVINFAALSEMIFGQNLRFSMIFGENSHRKWPALKPQLCIFSRKRIHVTYPTLNGCRKIIDSKGPETWVKNCSIRDHQQESMAYLSSKKNSFFDFWLYLHFPLFSPDWRVSSKQINVQPSIFGSCIPPGGISLDPGRPGTSIKAWKAGSIARCQGQRAIGKLLGGERLSKDDKGRSQVRKCDVDKM